jgi:hypothetical protein
VLNASDDSIWFGLSPEGLARYKDGRLDRFGWRQGVMLGDCRFIFEGLRGRIHAASWHRIYTYHPDETATPPPAWVNQWEEFLSRSHPIRDSQGNIWMFLKDHPDEISRWNGREWHHLKVPFDLTQASLAMADDRGHVYISMSKRALGAYEIREDEIIQHEYFQTMLVSAVEGGAKRFFTHFTHQDGIEVKGDEIWKFKCNGHGVNHYDGEAWTYLNLGKLIYSIHESLKHGILFKASDHTMTLDRLIRQIGQ